MPYGKIKILSFYDDVFPFGKVKRAFSDNKGEYLSKEFRDPLIQSYIKDKFI